MNRWVQGPIRTAAIWGTIISVNNQSLRKSIRQNRRSLDQEHLQCAASVITKTIAAKLFFRRATSVAFYMPFEGEVSPVELCSLSFNMGKQCYLPRMTGSKLTFEYFIPNSTPMKKNRFNIPEPASRQSISPRVLDVVFMPLVAFDQSGNRLGMGKGYYDNTFSGIERWWHKPLLIGLAHSFQEAAFQSHSGDVPMDAIVTESSLIYSEQRRKHLH